MRFAGDDLESTDFSVDLIHAYFWRNAKKIGVKKRFSKRKIR
jgi:hypothetical protein